MRGPEPKLFDSMIPFHRRESYWRRLQQREACQKTAIAQLSKDWFLIDRAALDLAERLTAVNRAFHAPLFIGDTGSFHLFHKHLPGSLNLTGNWTILSPGLTGTRIENAKRLPSSSPKSVISDPMATCLAPAKFDLVINLFHLHWLNDLPGALYLLREALQPDGLLLACLPGEDSLKPFRQALMVSEVAIGGGAGRRVNPMLAIQMAGNLLQRAGFALPVVDIDRLSLRYAKLDDLRKDLKIMGEQASFDSPAPRLSRAAWKDCQKRLSEHSEDGRISVNLELLHLSGWTPHSSQPQPLRPGTAQHSLAAALERIDKKGRL